MRHLVARCGLALLAAGLFAGLGGEGRGAVRAGLEPAGERAVPGELLVGFRPAAGAAARGAALAAVPGARGRAPAGGDGPVVVTLPAGADAGAAAERLAADPAVRYAEPNVLHRPALVPNDPLFPSLWGLHRPGGNDIDAPEAWELTTGSRDVAVAVVDTGVAHDHPDLAANMWTNPGEIPGNGVDDDGNGRVDDVHGWDFADGDADPRDPGGHGTHVAGTIGARGGNGVGVVGVAWSVSIMALRVGTTSFPTSAIVAAIGYACRNGARIVNGSFGGGGYSQALLDAIEQPACAETLFVFAAGNGGADGIGDSNDAQPFYPCSYPSARIVCVAATDQTGGRSSFSNYGATTVHLAAPGSAVHSTLPAWEAVAGTSDDFEGTAAEHDARWGLRSASAGSKLWGRTQAKARSGSFSLADSPSGPYAASSDTAITRVEPYDLRGRHGCRLAYWLALDTQAGHDSFDLYGGQTTATGTYLGGWSGTTYGSFVKLTTDLAAFDGEATVHVRFRLRSNATVHGDGVHLDDLAVECLEEGGAAYASYYGTSMAAPHVSGAAALALALSPDLTRAQLRAALLAGVDPVASLAGRVATGGRLNARRVLEAVAGASLAPPEATTVPARCTVPRLRGKPAAAAKRALRAAGCRLGRARWAYASSVKLGRVLRQSVPAGRRLRAGAPVTLVLSRGPSPGPAAR